MTEQAAEKRVEFLERAVGFLPKEQRTSILRQAAGQVGGRSKHKSETTDPKNAEIAAEVDKHYGEMYGPKLKQDHEAVQYAKESAVPTEFCGACVFFIGDRTLPWGTCSVVEGSIEQSGRCDLFEEVVPVRMNPETGITEEVEATVTFSKEAPGESVNVFVAFAKSDDDRRLVTSIVLEPDTTDLQNDRISKEEIERAAHRFMVMSRKIFLQHGKRAPSVQVVESYLAPTDLEFTDKRFGAQKAKAGSWLMTVKVLDDVVWEDVKSGKYTGFSIGGRALRTPEAA